MLNDQHNYIISSANCNNISLDNLYKNNYNTQNNKFTIITIIVNFIFILRNFSVVIKIQIWGCKIVAI